MSVDLGTRPGFLNDLRNGERIAFVRFFELFRLPVYNLVLRLVGGERDTAAVTQEVFIRAYRQLLVHEGAIAVRPLVYKLAVDTCIEPGIASPAGHGLREPGGDRATRCEGWEDSRLARRFEQTLQTLDYRQRAALLLNDVVGLPRDETAAVLGLTVEATAALVFRAGETFRRTFEELGPGRADGTCRLAETAAASAVGRRSLAADEARKLREHTEYCRQCRSVAATWTAPAIGLSMFARDEPLPRSLQVVPVFGTPSLSADSAEEEARPGLTAAGGSGTVAATLAGIGRALTSKATAYAVAAACSVAFLGLAVYVSQHEWQVRRQLASSPGRSVTAASRHAGQTAVAQTPGRSVARGPGGRASRSAGTTNIVVGSEVAETPDAHNPVTLALAQLSPPATSLRQIGPLPDLGDGVLPGGSAAADTSVAHVRHKANKDNARAGGGRASLHVGPAGSSHLGKGNGRHSKADKPSRGARQRLHLHGANAGHRHKA